MSTPSSSASSQPLPFKEFTEKWLQALTLAATMKPAQQVKPLISDIDALCSYGQADNREESGRRVWDFCSANGLLPLLQVGPFQHPQRRFEDDECFTFTLKPPSLINDDASVSLKAWLEKIGVVPSEEKWMAHVTYSDWTNLLRKELVRNGRSLNMSAMPEGSLLDIDCVADWDGKSWTIRFENPSWMTLQLEGRYGVDRPDWESVEDIVEQAMIAGEANLVVNSKDRFSWSNQDTRWSTSIPKLVSLHEKVIQSNGSGFSADFQRVWGSVWPVIYREQNRPVRSCDLNHIRKELEWCFRVQPKLTIWTFVFAKLVCQMQCGNGLGVSGDYA